MKIKEILNKNNSVEAELLLAHVLKKPKEFLYLHPEQKLTQVQIARLTPLIKRRLHGEPVAYILGYKDFYGFRFKVNQNVLIPRPETEWVVERVVKEVASSMTQVSPLRILDLGTGSGCIGVCIAKQLEKYKIHNTKYKVFASDISQKALVVARQNAKKHEVKIKFFKSNLLNNAPGNFDIIIANLPYGWSGGKVRFSSVEDGLKYEPQKALFAKEQGLKIIRQLFEQIVKENRQPKFLYLEFDPRQKQTLKKLINKVLPQSNTVFHKDFRNLWRYAEVRSNQK